MLYEGDKLKEISFPLGGIGSGCIGLAGNGELVDWEIFNRPHKNDDNRWRHRHTHFALRAFDKDKNVIDARVLVGDRKTNYMGDGGGATVSTMNGFPHFEKTPSTENIPLQGSIFLIKASLPRCSLRHLTR